jgi:hypothetical protein
MSLMHDIIKIKYTRLGYLPNYPYHLISDEEMFDAFINLYDDTSGSGDTSTNPYFFDDYYPNPFKDRDIIYVGPTGEQISLRGEYIRLKKYITNLIVEYLNHLGSAEEDNYTIPDWVYSYMLGEVIYNVPGDPDDFEYRSILDLLTLFDSNNINNYISPEVCSKCYAESTKYISTLTTGIRPPTVFGEPHVIKQLRMEN